MKPKKIKRNKEDIFIDEDFKPENVRATISIRIPADVLEAYRVEADRLGIGYQTLMQMKLKEAIDKSPLEVRIEKIEKELFSKHG